MADIVTQNDDELSEFLSDWAEEVESNGGDVGEIGSAQDKRPNQRPWHGVMLQFNQNFTNGDVGDVIRVFTKLADKWAFQEETSPDGHNHFQCILHLRIRRRPKGLAKIIARFLGIDDKCVQVKKDKTDESFVDYCTKIDTRDAGPWSHGFPEIRERPLKVIKRSDFYPWQEEVYQMVKEQPDDRSVYWYWSYSGNMGKTAMCKWLIYHLDAQCFWGDANDVGFAIGDRGIPTIAVWNIQRKMGSTGVNYKSFEMVKDGLTGSGKYKGSANIFDPPHVLIFANFPPVEENLSDDRWKIREVREADLEKAIDFE